MKELVKKMLKHAEKRKQEFWGRDENIWKFYEGISVCCRDLLLQEEAKNGNKKSR